MGMFSGYKTGDDLLLLNSERRIAVSRMWALRAIAIVLVLMALGRAATGGPSFAMGTVIAAGLVYIFGLEFASTTDGVGK